MRVFKSLLIVAGALFVLVAAAPVQATNARSWVASNGNNANPCTRAQPCANFNFTPDAMTAGGTIYSYGSNILRGNFTSNGTPTATVGPQ